MKTDYYLFSWCCDIIINNNNNKNNSNSSNLQDKIMLFEEGLSGSLPVQREAEESKFQDKWGAKQ